MSPEVCHANTKNAFCKYKKCLLPKSYVTNTESGGKKGNDGKGHPKDTESAAD